ncbi:MAG: PhzF family phenazine biosynthesis protein [Actinomycetota bacterium]|nr:PhzF family phenazine biosynthesis protein [Actinomycetota bacterium]
MATLHLLRVFVNDEGEFGNRLGVFLDATGIPAARRQEITAELGYSETVFVDNRETGELQIFTPATELPFAGHPLVGTAWLLRHEGVAVPDLRPPAGEVGVRFEDSAAFVSADPAWAPGFEPLQLADAAAVKALAGAPTDAAETYAWAWVDEDAGMIRARGFAPKFGIPEDEATGSAALALCAMLGRPVTIHQGSGSVLVARPLDDGTAEVGGEVALDDVREFA